MRPEFLQELVEKYPNDYDLGKAIREYYWILKENSNMTKEDAEKTFRIRNI